MIMEKKSYKAEEAGHYGPKMTVMQPTVVNVDGPSENVASEGMLCSNENYHNCDDYNTEFCRKRCEFAPKSGDDDIILPDIEPDK